MSFGPSQQVKQAEGNLGNISNTATGTMFPAAMAQGTNALNTGAGNVASGANFFNTLLQGNQANTVAALQPSIDQIRGGSTNALNAINTLMPRGGGRFGALFGQSFAPQSQIQNMFNQGRTAAAQALPGIGLQQQQLGANLFGLGNQALGIGTGASGQLGNIGLQQEQISNALASGLGSGLFKLGTTPLTGAGGGIIGAGLGKLGGLFGIGG